MFFACDPEHGTVREVSVQEGVSKDTDATRDRAGRRVAAGKQRNARVRGEECNRGGVMGTDKCCKSGGGEGGSGGLKLEGMEPWTRAREGMERAQAHTQVPGESGGEKKEERRESREVEEVVIGFGWECVAAVVQVSCECAAPRFGARTVQ